MITDDAAKELAGRWRCVGDSLQKQGAGAIQRQWWQDFSLAERVSGAKDGQKQARKDEQFRDGLNGLGVYTLYTLY
jgi:hypothetical protein